MKHAQTGLILASVGLPLLILASAPTRADDNATGDAAAAATTPAAGATDEAAPKPAAMEAAKPGETKPGRLRFRSAKSSGCTPATGGVSEADIHRAEEGRSSAKN